MNPNPRSRTSRLIDPLAIRVSLGHTNLPSSRISIPVPAGRPMNSAKFRSTGAAQHLPVAKNRTTGVTKTGLFHGDRDDRARAGDSVVQVVAELQRQLV